MNRNSFGQYIEDLVPWNKGHKGIEKFPERHFPQQCMDALKIHQQQQKDGVYKRFNSKFMIDGGSSCWLWQAGKYDERGYGQFYYNGKNVSAHRFSYEMYIGKIPKGLTLDHLCRNKSCVNPLHLEPVTLIENVLRGDNEIAKNHLKTHCKLGHPYDSKNTYFKSNGERNCRMCGNQRQKEYQKRKNGGVDVPR